MDAEECIAGRRSVRKFTNETIPRQVIRDIVDLARYAPSWKNVQSVRYHAVTNQAVLLRLAQEATADFTHNAKTLQRCKALMVLTSVLGLSGFGESGHPCTPLGEHWQSFDAGIAAQTFCLAAYSKGVGSVILGIFDEPAVRSIISLPDDERIACLIAMGYPLDPHKPAPPRLEIDQLLSFIA